ncbi:MAG: hypothetical protein IKG18_01800 [Atopobiaceae bacterium]|nr:hypothetical protein [Atopobiaceae bacterium]
MANKEDGLVLAGQDELELFEGMHEVDERVLDAARTAINEGRMQVARVTHSSMVGTYWKIGKEIIDAVGNRAAYGKHLIAYLSDHLTAEYGKGFGERTLRDARQFYRTYPIWHEVRAKLGWTQYRRIMRLKSAEAREFYASECEASNWSEAELETVLRRNRAEFEARLLRELPDGVEDGGDMTSETEKPGSEE